GGEAAEGGGEGGRGGQGGLDWIVLKALAKERDRRDETANGFAKDIERFLNHEPVTAGPPTVAKAKSRRPPSGPSLPGLPLEREPGAHLFHPPPRLGQPHQVVRPDGL